MATYHIDLVNGNDSNSGLDWANAWKTFTNGATAARIAPGDHIKCAETAAPTSIGTATWTSGKVGNSITFATAPTKQVDTCKSGWVTMGTGSTVTNGQTTAFVTYTTFGGTTKGALQWVTSSSANGCYKDLGSTQDFSAHQQISFWWRSSAGFDCTGAQDMILELCSDASATVVVNTLTFPSWNYIANMWYPMVLDNGSALSANVRSVRVRTVNSTSQTFYMDEMFASPAGGLTLRSLIGLNDNDWYAIRCIRDADVQLLAGFNPTVANGMNAGPQDPALDASWMGTTQTSTTWKLEPSIALLPTGGPSASAYGVNVTEAAQLANPSKFSGGWNTSTNQQTGITFLDNVTHTSGSTGLMAVSTPYTLVENFGIVRFATSIQSTSGYFVMKDCWIVACGASGTAGSGLASGFHSALITNWNPSSLGFKSITCCTGGVSSFGLGSNQKAIPIIYGNMWGNHGQSSQFTTPAGGNLRIQYGNLYPVVGSATLFNITTGSGNKITIGDVKVCATAAASNTYLSFLTMTGQMNTIKMGDVVGNWYQSSLTYGGSNNTLIIKSFTNTGGGGMIGYFEDGNVIKVGNYSGNLVYASGGSFPIMNGKLYFHEPGAVDGYFRVYCADQVNATPGYFELQSTDVYTSGSKAIRFVGGTLAATQAVAKFDLKIASAAAEANKLVTVSCRIKRNSSDVTASICIPGFTGMLPGYTEDVTAAATSVGEWDLVTVTFTPTANCVFDVMACLTPTGAVTPTIIWDALTITQAA